LTAPETGKIFEEDIFPVSHSFSECRVNLHSTSRTSAIAGIRAPRWNFSVRVIAVPVFNSPKESAHCCIIAITPP
jgi:hypothetical protein